MAVSEGDEGSPPSQGNTTTTTDANEAGAAASGNEFGPRYGRYPIASSDYFSGELPPIMDITSANTQAVLGSIGDRVTSVTGSPSLDVISRTTAVRTVSRLDSWPQTDVRADDTAAVHSTSNLVVSPVPEVATEALQTVSESTNSDMINSMSLPSLSMSSINNEGSESDTSTSRTGPCQNNAQTPGHVKLSDSPEYQVTFEACQESLKVCDLSECSGINKSVESVKDKTAKSVHDPGVPKLHFGESSEIPQPQLGSSGYGSTDTTTQDSNGNKKSCQSRGSGVSISTDIDCNGVRSSNDFPITISPAGINKMIRATGTQTSPVFPKYSSFPSRLVSFPHGFRLGDGVEVNRDLLALAGFYYSGWDTVTCYHCGCNPRVWGDGRDPETEHRMLAPYCKALVHQ